MTILDLIEVFKWVWIVWGIIILLYGIGEFSSLPKATDPKYQERKKEAIKYALLWGLIWSIIFLILKLSNA